MKNSKEIPYVLPESTKKRLNDKKTAYIFSRNAQKSRVYNKPLFVIGLGGSGFDVLSTAKEKMVNCFQTNSCGEMEGVEFLEIDTDDRDMKKVLASPYPGSLKKEEFKIFQNADIGAILRNRRTNSDVLPEEIDEWLDPDIPIAQIVHGAAGIRQAGRLLLHLNDIAIISTIKDKLNKIRESVALGASPVNVVIFTGLGGGTGSGIFIDIAYIVRECIKEFSGQAFITGILLMPDILSGDPNVDKITKENIKRNGFAALKELDHLMNLSETQDTFSQAFPSGFNIEETNEAVFDRCVLVSSMAEGRLLLPNAKAHAYNIAAEMLIDMVSNSSMVSNGSNDVNRSDAALRNMKKPKPANYVYTAIGGQSVYLDFDLVFNLFVKSVLEYDINMNFSEEEVENEVEKIWTEEGIKEEIDKLVNAKETIPVDGKGLYRITDSIRSEDIKIINKSYIKKNCNAEYKIRRNNDRYEAYQKDLEELDRKAQDLLDKLRDVYAGIDVRYDNHIDKLKKRIQDALNETNKTDSSEDNFVGKEIDNYEQEIKKFQKYFRKHKKHMRFGNGPKLREPSEVLQNISKKEAEYYKTEKYREVIIYLQQEISRIFVVKHKENMNSGLSSELQDFYSAAKKIWKDMAEKKYDAEYKAPGQKAGSEFVQDSLEALWERSDSLIGKSSIVPGNHFRNISVSKYINIIEKNIKENYTNLIDAAAREYRKEMTDSTKTEYYQGKKGDFPDITTGMLFENSFRNLKVDLDDIIMELLEVSRPELNKMWEEVITSILDHSGVLFSKKAMKDGEVFERPSYIEFMIPKGNEVLAAVYKEQTGQNAEESEISNRISCMRYNLCYKIDDYIYIDELERVYNQSNSKSGLHLYENGNVRWEKLPSPVYRNTMADWLKQNIYEDARTAIKYRIVFSKACSTEERLIQYDRNAKKMYIHCPTLQKLLNNKGYKIELGGIEKAYICTLEYNEAREEYWYPLYCAEWFVKMYRYRELVAKALEQESSAFTEDDLNIYLQGEWMSEIQDGD